MGASQRFGRFAIPFRVPLLLSLRMARVTAGETSSREVKRCPRMGSFNLWNKSNSSGLMSGLNNEWGNTSHSYLLSKSITTFPRCGRALSCKMSGPSRSRSGWICAFLCAIFASGHDSTLLSHLFHMEFYLSLCFLGDHKQRSSYAGPLIALNEIFWAAKKLDFSIRSTAISTPVQSL